MFLSNNAIILLGLEVRSHAQESEQPCAGSVACWSYLKEASTQATTRRWMWMWMVKNSAETNWNEMKAVKSHHFSTSSDIGLSSHVCDRPGICAKHKGLSIDSFCSLSFHFRLWACDHCHHVTSSISSDFQSFLHHFWSTQEGHFPGIAPSFTYF